LLTSSHTTRPYQLSSSCLATATTVLYTLSLHDALPISVTPGGHPAVDHVAAGLGRDFARHFRIVLPQRLAGCPVVGLHFAPGGGDVDRAVDDERRSFLAARGVEVGEPDEAELADGLGTDLVERAVALLGIVATVRDPVGAVGCGVGQPISIDATFGSAF